MYIRSASLNDFSGDRHLFVWRPTYSNFIAQKYEMTIKGRGQLKKSIFLGNSPKQRTPPTHRYSLGLT